MPDFVDRIRAERDALKEKNEKLCLFIQSKAYKDLTHVEQFFLYQQTKVMDQYEYILDHRISFYEHG